jgi:uncharacterized protein
MDSPLARFAGVASLCWPQILLLIVSCAGGAVAALFALPAAWLSGGMIAVAALAATGAAVSAGPTLRQTAVLFAGVALGSAATPDMVDSLAHFPLSLAILGTAIVAITAAGTVYLKRLPGWSRETALFASLPGALSLTLTVAATTNADIRRIAVVQIFRVFVLVALLPPVLAAGGLRMVASSFAHFDPPWMLCLLLAGGLATGLVFERLRIGSGMLLGALAFSATLHATSVAPGRLPAWFQMSGQICVGAWMGSRFVGFDWRLLGHSLRAAIGAFVLSLMISASFAYLTTLTLSIPFADTIVAFAPGAVEAMTVLAFALGLDPLYVGSHHLARFIVISLAAPLLLRSHFLQGNDRRHAPSRSKQT